MGKIDFKQETPTAPLEMMVYRVIQPNHEDESARDLAYTHFGLGRSSEARLTRVKNQGILEIWDDAQFVAVGRDRDSIEYAKVGWLNRARVMDKPTYPDEKTCETIARDFLQEHSLLPKDAIFHRTKDYRERGCRIMAYFVRKIDNRDTYGAGAQIRVDIGPSGEVVGMLKSWQRLEPFKCYPIRPVIEALFEVRTGRPVTEITKGSTDVSVCAGEVVSHDLVYYTSPQVQDFVQPCYRFIILGTDGQEFHVFVPAVRSEYLTP